MADALFTLRVLSPLGTVFEGKARSATLPTADGEIMILAHHMPLVCVLVDGEMRVDTGQKVVSIAIAGGFLDTSAGAASAASASSRAATVPGGIRRPPYPVAFGRPPYPVAFLRPLPEPQRKPRKSFPRPSCSRTLPPNQTV